MIELSETCTTLGGESPILGEPVFIVRCAGCNLHCSYCDTLYARETSYIVSEQALVESIAKIAGEYPSIKVLVTGGEPLLGSRQGSIISIASSLPNLVFYVETNGSVEIEDTSFPNCCYIVDIKAPSSGHEHSFVEANLRKLRPKYDCIKIVLRESDFGWAKERIRSIRKESNELPIYLSPQSGEVELALLADFILSNRLPVSMSIQLHKIIWGQDAKGV